MKYKRRWFVILCILFLYAFSEYSSNEPEVKDSIHISSTYLVGNINPIIVIENYKLLYDSLYVGKKYIDDFLLKIENYHIEAQEKQELKKSEIIDNYIVAPNLDNKTDGNDFIYVNASEYYDYCSEKLKNFHLEEQENIYFMNYWLRNQKYISINIFSKESMNIEEYTYFIKDTVSKIYNLFNSVSIVKDKMFSTTDYRFLIYYENPFIVYNYPQIRTEHKRVHTIVIDQKDFDINKVATIENIDEIIGDINVNKDNWFDDERSLKGVYYSKHYSGVASELFGTD